MEIKEEDKVEIIKTFLTEVFRYQDNLLNLTLDDISEYKDLIEFFRDYDDAICKAISGRSISELEYENSEMVDEIDELRDSIIEYRNKLKYFNRIDKPQTLWELSKIEIISDYINDYTPWHLEFLLQNGQQLLNLKK